MKKIKRGIAFLLCMSMLFGIAPYSAYATGSDAALNPIEEPVPDQDLEPTEEGIVELGWESCGYMDASGNFSPNNTLVKASGKEIISISAIWNEEYEDLLLSLYGEAGEFEAYDINVEGYKEGDTLTLSFEMGLEYFVNGVDNLKIYWIDTVEDVVNTEELTIQKKEFHTEADGVEFVTVTFETTKTGVFAIGNVEEVPEEPQTRELIIKNLPSKLEYQLGEEFDKSGLEVAYVKNGFETILPKDEYEVTGADLSIIGQQTVTVTYGELTASFDIMVCEPEEVQTGELIIKQLPTKLVYQLGEDFEASGLEVFYVENDIETPLSVNEYTVTADLSKNGQQTVTVSYGTLSASFDIWVCDPKKPINVGIAVKELPAKTEYVAGETFDDKGLKVVMYYDNGKEEEIGTYYLSEADTMTPGVNPVTVTSGSHTTVFYITVKEPQPEPVEEEMTVTLEDNSKLKVKIKTSALEKVTYKITDVHNYIWVNTLLSKVYDGDFIALNIQPDENFIPGEKTTVTLPRPAHITSPAVYCLTEEDGIIERIMDVTVEGDKVSFVTDHFSVYAIGEGDTGDRYPVVVEEEAWVETTGLKNGEPILILNSNNGSAGGTSAQALSIQTANNNDGVKSETVTIYHDGTKSYVLPNNVKDNSQWNPIYSEPDWKFQSVIKNNRYINTERGLLSGRSLITSTNGAAFTYENMQLTYEGWFDLICYIGYTGEQWDIDITKRNIYIFEKGTYDKLYQLELALETADNIPPAGGKYVYTVDGEDLKAQVIPSGVPTEKNGTYEYVSLAEDIATVDSNGEISFTGEVGSTIIQATYWWVENGKRKETKSFIEIEAVKPVYEIDIVDQKSQSITNTIPIKNVISGYEYQLGAKLTKDEKNAEIDPERVTWISSDPSIATVEKDDNGNCKVIFTGEEGSVRVTVLYTYADGSSSVTDSVMFSVKQDDVTIPSDGTDDFPEYPNEGSIRFDKHATAVGNFSDTGVVQVELSMTGVPYTVGNEIDVVMMLDTSSSIADVEKREEAARDAAKAALEILVKNEDGTFNGNRVAIYGFDGWSNSGYGNHIEAVYDNYPTSGSTIDKNSGKNNVNISQISEMKPYDSKSFQAANTSITNQYEKSNLGEGTNYAAALRQCYLTLAAAAKENPNRKQYVIFMTDGFASTGFAYQTNNGKSVYTNSQLGNNGLNGIQYYNLHQKTEYYSELMKEAGVEIFTVGLQVGVKVTSDQTYRGYGETVLKNIAGTSQGNANDEGFENYAMFVDANETDVSKLVDIFKTITMSIKQAATNVVVTDKIADEYTMIFEPPKDQNTNENLLDDQELYIEVLNYELEPVTVNGTITDYVRGEADSLSKIYLKRTGDSYSAADKNGKEIVPEFKAVADAETKKYWKASNANDYDVKVGNQYYEFMPKGDGTHNMVSGAYASGTVDDNSEKEDGNSGTTSSDLKIASPYFFYDASTRILVWTAEKLDSYELALSYFLYLDRSAGWEKEENPTLPGTYETNDYATLRYTNHLGKNCEQEFPVPQMTWNGAQVSYVFYLVNDNGQPVNRAGRVIPFSEAVYITDVFTESVVWNDWDESGRLSAGLLAKDLVPDVYTLYDPQAAYTIHVFEDETGANLNNHFKIDGDAAKVDTTYVFNTKSDAQKYTELGIYAKPPKEGAMAGKILCKDYNVTVTNGSYEYKGTSVQYEKDGKPVYDTEEVDGVEKAYTIIVQQVDAEKKVDAGFDFSNTTVAFAVKWVRELVPDTIVMDYGLDVVIDVAYNDGVNGTVVGVRTDPHESGFNGKSGMCNASQYSTVPVYLNNRNETNFKIGTASLVNNTSVRFSLDKQNGMQMKDWAQFYYESTISYYNGTNLEHQDMYTSVTVIPATTIYYEDEYVTLSTLTKNGSDIVTVSGWQQNSQQVTDTQQVDRPGSDKIGAQYDADNLYGSDAAYLQCSTASMKPGAKINVGANNAGTAEFEFYGTGFDVISMTSNKTGTIIVDVSGKDGFEKSYVVDTYYGYKYVENPTKDFNNNGDPSDDHWIIDDNDADNSLWQIPVIKVEGLPYGKYDVKITAAYSAFFDHGQYENSTYDFYLDAIRIYDPAGRDEDNLDELIKKAYISDREYLPEYYELRNMVIEANTFGALTGTDAITGIVFIDGKKEVTTGDIQNYISYGPNNELYLAPGQSVVFSLNAKREDKKAVDMVQLAWKSVGGTAKAKIWNSEENASSAEVISVKTATDMYFDITDLNGKTVVIQNAGGTGDSILSITNMKVTAKEEPAAAQEMAMFSVSRAAVQQALLSLNNEIVEPEPPAPEPPKQEETTPVPESPTPESPKPEETKPAPENSVAESPKPEETKPAPENSVAESPKPEETKPAPENSVAESPKQETETTIPETSEPEDDNHVSDDMENQESETEKLEETTEKGIIAKLIEFIRLLVRSIVDWFSRWF